MRILCAPDSFKGSLTAKKAALAMERGIRQIFPEAEVTLFPIADGGEGTREVLLTTLGGKRLLVSTTGPLGQKQEAQYALLPDGTAVIESASACGLPDVPLEKRNPALTTTLGLGELILHALDHGCRSFIIGVGGTATTDGGIGMAHALGYRFLSAENEILEPIGQNLDKIVKIQRDQLDPRLKETSVVVVCDVQNTLYGENGAAYVFGPQKGATPQQVKSLDEGLHHLSQIVQTDLQKDTAHLAGAGGGGGLGYGLAVFTNARLENGIDYLLEKMNIDHFLQKVDLCITGEGQIDFQITYGKALHGVAMHAKRYHVPVLAIAGSIGPGADEAYNIGINAFTSLVPGPMSLQEAMSSSETLLQEATTRLLRTLLVGQNLQIAKK